ncbi:ATP-dependent zinc metalloprotease FtsH [Dysosmobacter segnis]|uniref:ATP-dependent zinc metalloprotease FtsH n=1 Tax=Dysosmobacter segnis TaxID=2763042 RepID=A0A923S5R0_9FIRM|nr:ATP-dependent zinc metalloprotease FtsH [Dysosmobacter segnis]MBC5768830.1 ATP-dependent zinc metalloprotease FtsH [Dysosmobacter segnis]
MVKRRPGVSILPLMLIVILCVSWLTQLNQRDEMTYDEMVQLFEQQKVEAFRFTDSSTLMLQVKGSDQPVRCRIHDYILFYSDLNDLVKEQKAAGIIKSYSYPPPEGTDWLGIMLPYLMMALMFGGMWYLMSVRAQGGMGPDRMAKFGSAQIRGLSEKDKQVTFADVAGADEEKEELREIVEFLKNPKKYIDLGARIPKGVLLVGPPGTGKTLLAKAVAGEAGVGFLSISGSDFVELYVGVGASRVRDLFEQAKKQSPAIVFIDEIDAVGRQRGTGLGGGHDEREQTLNQLLVEMDGFAANEGVVVLAATNRADVLDPALLRPGRFDRQVYVGLPDIKGREEILKVHAKGKPLAEDVSLRKLAQGTAGFTGADLENLINEGALLAARKDQHFITMQNLKDAEIKVIAGPEKKSRVIPQHERELTAYHEAGHAVVMHMLPGQDPVSQITIVPRGMAGGMTISLPEEDRSYLSKHYMEDQVVGLLGGRVAEKLCLNDISTGASNDIQRATAIARKMVTVYGMSERLGTVSFDSGNDEVFIGRTMGHSRGYSEAVAAQIDQEVKDLVDGAYRRCQDILEAQRDKLEQVAQYLLEHETMERDAFLTVFGEKTHEQPENVPAADAEDQD